MNKNVLILWQTGSYTEDTIVHTLLCSYVEFRLALIQADMQVPAATAGVHEEIYREHNLGADERYDSAEWISKSYGISYSTARRYCKEPAPSVSLTGCTDEDIKRHLDAGFDPMTVAELLGCTSLRIRKIMQPARANITADVKDAIVSELNKNVPQKTIALKYGVSESSVSKLNPNKVSKPKKKPLDEKSWDSLKVSMQRYSVSELARMYNVSRAYIYARLAKEKQKK